MIRLLIIGKSGQLGSMLINDAKDLSHQIIAPSEKELDITNSQVFSSYMNEYLPDVVLNTAAYHNVPLCENNPIPAFQVNCIAVREMARICEKMDKLFVTISTDYVFDGKKGEPYIETDKTGPLQIYGLSKVAGEIAALSYSNSIIIRTCGLYGLQGAESKGGNFPDNRLKDAKKVSRLEISNDQTISPTYTGDLSKAILKLISHPSKSNGIYHLINEGSCTWYEFTKEIFQIMNIYIELIPVDRKGKEGKMRRPIYTALRNTKATKLGIILPHWKDAIKKYLEIKYKKKITRN
ncbi:MAG: dTDP-4-dehydrorhamnose reductase [Candidatus Lokiarchaeota archaeon]|nr:dTDP-4-dehydrorhamnose reductase [Candidatus Lokiarchaeota archaeon]